MKELFRQALHFPVNGKEQSINVLVEQAVAFRDCSDRRQGSSIVKGREYIETSCLRTGRRPSEAASCETMRSVISGCAQQTKETYR
jgi:hypothetical protein